MNSLKPLVHGCGEGGGGDGFWGGEGAFWRCGTFGGFAGFADGAACFHVLGAGFAVAGCGAEEHFFGVGAQIPFQAVEFFGGVVELAEEVVVAGESVAEVLDAGFVVYDVESVAVVEHGVDRSHSGGAGNSGF